MICRQEAGGPPEVISQLLRGPSCRGPPSSALEVDDASRVRPMLRQWPNLAKLSIQGGEHDLSQTFSPDSAVPLMPPGNSVCLGKPHRVYAHSENQLLQCT